VIVYSGSVEDPQELIRFFRREADNLRAVRKVIIFRDKTRVLDVNKDGIEFPGLTYGSVVLERLLRELGVVFNRQTLHDPGTTGDGGKEFDVSARWTWGHDRVM
jgi:hypothetical protein